MRRGIQRGVTGGTSLHVFKEYLLCIVHFEDNAIVHKSFSAQRAYTEKGVVVKNIKQLQPHL